MKRIYLIVGLLSLGQLAFGQTKNFIDQPYLETSAKVDTLIKPDIIYLDILIREKDERDKMSVEELESKMIQTLQSLGINTQKQLVLSDLASNFKKYFLKKTDIMKSKTYELKVFDSKTAGMVIVGLEDVGISNVSLERTEYSKMEKLKLELKSNAVLKAKRQADYMVKPLNQKVTRAIYIADRYYEQYYNNVQARLESVGYVVKEKTEPVQPEIEFKPIKVESEVTIKFIIE